MTTKIKVTGYLGQDRIIFGELDSEETGEYCLEDGDMFTIEELKAQGCEVEELD